MSKINIESIESIEEIEVLEDEWVYDITMTNTNTPYFFGNGILVHNSTYFTLPVDNKDDAILIADMVARQVNKSYPEFMKHAFLCQPGYDQFIQCGREVVSDSAIFVEKKRYIMHVVDNEGEAVDKLKIMGLDLKKTTLPKAIQKKLTDYIKRYMAGEEWLDIARDIVEYKQELSDFKNLLAMGLPKGINNIEEYTQQYEFEGDKTRLPGHVAASILFNRCLKEYNDTDNVEISSGTKIKVYYLKKPMGKFKAIALPTDMENIPDWFTEHFIDKIDKDLQVSKLVDNPLDNILKAVNLKSPTSQFIHAHDFFVF